MDDKNRVVYFLGVQYDITDQVTFQKEINELTAKLDINAQAALEEKTPETKQPFWKIW